MKSITKVDMLFLIKVLMHPDNQCYRADKEDLKILRKIKQVIKKS